MKLQNAYAVYNTYNIQSAQHTHKEFSTQNRRGKKGKIIIVNN